MYQIKQGDCLELMKSIPDGSIDLTVTSPPYDNLRTYENSCDWNFKIFTRIARELYRVTKDGGVVVWVVGDATINGTETGSSFRQALFFKRIGFNLHDTMIYYKMHVSSPESNRYYQKFEYMYCLSKGKPKTFNALKQKNVLAGKNITATKRDKSGNINKCNNYGIKKRPELSVIDNVWAYSNHIGKNETEHPAIFPESLANDHILSWSNEGDTILDPFLGSGTTAKMAIRNNRNFIGFEKVEKYFKIAEKRIQDEIDKTSLFNYDKAS